jgi:hypothetical protein
MNLFRSFGFSNLNFGLCFDEFSDAGGGNPSAAAPTTPATPASASTGAPAAAPATPSASQPPATGGSDDRVPSYRIRETRDQVTRQLTDQFNAERAQLKREMEQYQAQVRALVGVNPPQAQTEEEAIRAQFNKLFPGLAKMESNQEVYERLAEQADQLRVTTENYWSNHGRQTMDTLFKQAETDLGAPLNQTAKGILHGSLVSWLQADPARAARYETDPSIVNDFWKEYQSSLIEPSRRSVAAGVAGRAAAVATLPQNPVSGGVPTSQPAALPKGLDDKANLAWARFQQIRNGGV